jgi:squalene-hopene/tetraprenyl-beta-curcumene cyclase
VIGEHEAYCQPCVSPVWDTALTCHALLEAGGEEAVAAAKAGLDWLKPKQVLDVKGDWAVKRPDVRPGGWAFQYNNAHYPDLDDTAVVVMAMDRARARASRQRIRCRDRARPRMDRGHAEPRRRLGRVRRRQRNTTSTTSRSPITARCSIRRPRTSPRAASRCWRSSARPPNSKAVADGVDYLRRTQLAEGSWYGRWGMNYIYGTWSVLCALNAAGVDHQDPMMRKAVDWLLSIQNRTAAGARMPPATDSTTRDSRVRPRPPRKRHGPCLD